MNFSREAAAEGPGCNDSRAHRGCHLVLGGRVIDDCFWRGGVGEGGQAVEGAGGNGPDEDVWAFRVGYEALLYRDWHAYTHKKRTSMYTPEIYDPAHCPGYVALTDSLPRTSSCCGISRWTPCQAPSTTYSLKNI